MGKYGRESILYFKSRSGAERQHSGKRISGKMEQVTFAEKVYRLCQKVPEGKVTTYKELGKILGTKCHRAIGQALRRNISAQVPCHRVVNSDGLIGGYKGKLNAADKINLLTKEGVMTVNRKINLKKYLYNF